MKIYTESYYRQNDLLAVAVACGIAGLALVAMSFVGLVVILRRRRALRSVSDGGSKVCGITRKAGGTACRRCEQPSCLPAQPFIDIITTTSFSGSLAVVQMSAPTVLNFNDPEPPVWPDFEERRMYSFTQSCGITQQLRLRVWCLGRAFSQIVSITPALIRCRRSLSENIPQS